MVKTTKECEKAGRRLRLLPLIVLVLAAVPLALGAVDWPSDFWDQVAATHPAPSGTQVAVSASPAAVDARTSSATAHTQSVSGLEGRSMSSGDSGEWDIDPRKPSGLVIMFR